MSMWRKGLTIFQLNPNKDRTIRNVVEDCTALTEENEQLKRDNKSLKEKLDYAVSNNIKPIPQLEDLNKLKYQTKSKELYAKKLEEMVKASLEKLERFKDDLKSSK